MVEILTVCTGNICRSPVAELILRARLAPLAPVVSSAGVRGLRDAPMPDDAVRLASQFGIPEDWSRAHRSRFLTEDMLRSPDLILTMTRDQRRSVAELTATRLRSTFTVREFERLAASLSDAEIRAAAVGETAGERLRAAGALIASRRGVVPPPDDPEEDDVVDPYRRSWRTYKRAAAQFMPGLDQVLRVTRIAA